MKRIHWLNLFAVLVISLITAVRPALADGIIIVDPPPEIPIVHLDEALTIKYHHVEVTIEDQVATTYVDQVFVNENDWVAEGIYVFPLPRGAAVSDFVMWVDGKPITGEILKASEARQIYDDIVSSLRDPALLEYVGRDMVKASVFPIEPGNERRIELRYEQLLPRDNGLVHYVYPLSTERFSARPLEDASVHIKIDSREPIKAVYSPSHDVYVERPNDFEAVVSWESSNTLPDKDFELYYSVSSDQISANLLSFKESDDDGFFLLLLAPDVEVNRDELVTKDVIIVLDVSGSMQGRKLVQAKEAARYVLGHLNSRDRFGLVSFSTGTHQYQQGLAPASDADDAMRFVEGLEALGGTNIDQALQEALGMADSDTPTTLIFVTDGLATEGEVVTTEILSNVDAEIGPNTRVFSFGVGDDVDTILLDGLSVEHGGTSAYVRPGQRIDDIVSTFYSKVTTPVLSEVQVEFLGVSIGQVFPQSYPDLFAGSQMVIVGRYRDGGPATVRLTGTVNGKAREFEFDDLTFKSTGGKDFIPRLWAGRAIGHYLTQIRLHGENDEWVEAIIDLSIRYGIITPYTSFLIDEDDILSAGSRESLVEETSQNLQYDLQAPSYGSEAVEKAANIGGLRDMEAPAELPMVAEGIGGGVIPVQQVMKYVGSKTFIMRDGVWIDTLYDPDSMQLVPIEFMSQNYLDLASDLGSFFALGPRIIVVRDGAAYETVDEKVAPVQLPTPDVSETPAVVEPTPQPTPQQTTELEPDQVASPVPTSTDSSDPGGNGINFCTGALALPATLLVMATVFAATRPNYKI
ncbi:MAG: VIT domain-containing protein [Chloroflexota bacterium]